jgi:hypothetical protein
MSARLRRLTGSLTLVVFFATFATSLAAAHQRDSDDVLCGGAELGPHHETQAITRAVDPAAASANHCAICHWMRTIAGAASFGPAAMLPHLTDARSVASAPQFTHREPIFSQGPPRAPPLSTLL